MEAELSPVLHKNCAPPAAVVDNTADSPKQREESVAIMEICAMGSTVITIEADPVQF